MKYETSDLALASALQCMGHIIQSIDRTNPRKALFVFEQADELKLHVKKFWNGELLLEPLKYFNSIKQIKSRLYS